MRPQTHKWPKAGRSGRCERHGCNRKRWMTEAGKWLYVTGSGAGHSEVAGPCTGTTPEKKTEPVDDGRHRWSLTVGPLGFRHCRREGCGALWDVGGGQYKQHSTTRWGKSRGYCKGKR